MKEGTPINIYDAATGRTMWCHKGTDLQGEQSGQAVVIAGEYVAMTVVGRPVLSLVSMQMKVCEEGLVGARVMGSYGPAESWGIVD